jgi:(2Fe-2S) ferredoxin
MGLKDIRVNNAGCLDRCELGPCFVIYPEGVWYAPKTEADIDDILATHVQQGGRVERLMLPPRDQVA